MKTKPDRNMQSFANCPTTQKVCVCFSALQYGNPKWPWSHQAIWRILPCMGQHVFHHSISLVILAWMVPMSSTDVMKTKHFTYPHKKRSKGATSGEHRGHDFFSHLMIGILMWLKVKEMKGKRKFMKKGVCTFHLKAKFCYKDGEISWM